MKNPFSILPEIDIINPSTHLLYQPNYVSIFYDGPAGIKGIFDIHEKIDVAYCDEA